MIRKFNLALMPKHEGQSVIQLANILSHLSHNYCLGMNSFPHVTLYQFMFDINEVYNLWNKVCECVGNTNLNLTFTSYECSKYGEYDWIFLLPHQKDDLFLLHHQIANLVNLKIKKDFYPHMTLINTLKVNYQEEVKKILKGFTSFEDNFSLSLGYCDEVGQVTEILYK